MTFFIDAIAWIFAPEHDGLPNRVAEKLLAHSAISALALLVASVIAVPLGLYIGHTGRGKQLAVGLSGAARALPSLGLLTILALALGISRGTLVAVIVLLLLGVPSVLAGAYAGVEAIDRRTIDAARAVGMTEWQILRSVELPLALPLMIGGVRSAGLQIIATATLASYIGLGGLGDFIFAGLATRDYSQLIAGAILVAALALAADGAFAILQRIAVPHGVVIGRRRELRAKSARLRSAAG